MQQHLALAGRALQALATGEGATGLLSLSASEHARSSLPGVASFAPGTCMRSDCCEHSGTG